MSDPTGNKRLLVTESDRADLRTGDRRPSTRSGYVFVNERRAKPARPPTAESVPDVSTVPKRYPDPMLCACDGMLKATAHRLIDVAFRGPIFLVPLIAQEAAALRGEISFAYAEAAMRRLIRLRHCPFDGALMDPEVGIEPLAPHGADEPPCCCGTMDDLARAERVRLPSLRTDRDVFARCQRPDGRSTFFSCCPFCAKSMHELAIERRRHALASLEAETLDLALST